MRSRLSLAVGLAAAFALNVATPANAHHSSKHSSKRSQVTTPKAAMVKQRVRRSASDVSRAYGQAPYNAGDAYYGSAWSAAGPSHGGSYYGGPYYGDAYYGDTGFAYHGYGQAPFESPGPAPRQSRMRANASRDTGNTYSQPSTDAGAAQARFESSASPAAPTTRPAARQRTRASANDAGSAYGQAPSERSARAASNQQQSGQSGQCFISMDSSRGQGYFGDCSTKGAVQSK